MALGSGSLPASQALPLIRQAESGGRNVTNYAYDATHTASGYYQITNTTWNRYAASAGVDTSQYPTAISAPESVQAAVATSIYNNEGASPWSKYDAPLRASLAAAGDTSDLGTYVGPLGTGAGSTSNGAGTQGSVDPSGNVGPQGDAVASAAGAGQSPSTGLMATVAEIATRGSVLLVGLVVLGIGLVWAMRRPIAAGAKLAAKAAVVA